MEIDNFCITRASVQQQLSPSSVSTTSLAQLPEKLSLLLPIQFINARMRICTTPELHVITEENEDVLSDGFTEGDSVLKGNTNKQSPEKELTRRKRKLYSPKDDDNENNEIPITRKVRRPSTSSESPIASTRRVVSPETKKSNDKYDSIKDIVVSDEKITIVPKKSDKDFQKKKIQVQKHISSSSFEIRSKRKSVKPVNYSSYFSSEDEDERVLIPKKVKQTKPRSCNIRTPKINLIDERMRKPQLEVLGTSFVEENIETNISKEPEPALNQAPVLETIASDDLHGQPIVSERKIKTPNKSDIIKVKTEKSLIKKREKLLKSTGRKKIQEINKNVPTEGDSSTVSPLPGLVVETEPRKDDLTSNLLQNFKKIYTDVINLSGTQNGNNDGMETIQHSFINLDNYDDNTVDPKENLQTIDLTNGSEKSIKTVGSFPITGHINTDESPPNIDALNESFQHRDVHIEGMSKSTTEFLNDMRTELRNIKAAERSTSPVIPTKLTTKNSKRSNVCANTTGSCKVVLKSISTDEINSWMPKPGTKDKDKDLRKYDSIKTKVKGITAGRTSPRPKTMTQPCNICETTEPKISNVKFNVTAAKQEKERECVNSVKGWIQRNIVASPSPADDYAARRETLLQEVEEALDTRLIEIQDSICEAMTAALLKDKEELARLQEQIVSHQKNQMDRACAIIREGAQKMARFKAMLTEDIQRILK